MATSLHSQLKRHYVADEDRHEIDVDQYRIDAVCESGTLIEIQCASLLAIRDKIRRLTKTHQVILVKPLAARKLLLKKARRNGKVVSRRYSPTRETFPWVFQELVHFTNAFPHPNLQLDVVLTEQEEIRVPAKRKTWRRKHSVYDRSLLSIQETCSLRTVDDLWNQLDMLLPERFTTGDMAAATGMPRWLAQKAAYCFRKMNHIAACGRQGNAIEYQLCSLESQRREAA
ncbi:MAG: hypothetical protein R3C49_27250 [Planctomycetaceae bacterium]